jgi:hypothetical protein
MYQINQIDTMLVMAIAMFFLGMCTLILGMFILVSRGSGRSAKKLTAQAAMLLQKGIADDMAGLVGNATALLDNLSAMVKTAAGVGIFLTTLGLSMMAGGYYIVLQINWPV